MEPVSITLEAREGTGSAYCRRLRKTGYLPCVVYGPKMEAPVSAKVLIKTMYPYLMSDKVKTTPFAVTLPDGTVKNCVIRSASMNHATDQLLHIDFFCAE